MLEPAADTSMPLVPSDRRTSTSATREHRSLPGSNASLTLDIGMGGRNPPGRRRGLARKEKWWRRQESNPFIVTRKRSMARDFRGDPLEKGVLGGGGEGVASSVQAR